MRFRVLGEVTVDGVPSLRPKQRQLLAALLVRRGRPVRAEVLAEDLWEAPPPSAVASVHSHASRLRGELAAVGGADLLTGGARGYAAAGPSDAEDFEAGFVDGRNALLDGAPARAAALLKDALGLWRGPAYGELAVREPWRAEAARLEEVRRAAQDDLLRALLALGRHDEVLFMLPPLQAAEPLREHLWAARMLALAGTGRQADALESYRRLHRLLADELGVAPDPSVQELHQRLVRQEAPVLAPVGTRTASALPRPRPTTSAVRWAASGGVHIAYQVVGDGPVDLLWIPSYLSHLELHWQWPSYAHLLSSLAARTRLVVMDKRGVGLSDRVHTDDLAQRAQDVRAVLDAVGSRRVVVLASSEGAASAVPFAVASPERVAGLVLFGCMPSLAGEDFPHGPTPEAYLQRMSDLAQHWGTGRSLRVFAPSAARDPEAVAWYARMERDAVTPGGLLQMAQTSARMSYASLLPELAVPTLVLHRKDEVLPSAAAARTAALVPGGRLVELEGQDHLMWFGDTAPVLAAVLDFVEQTAHR